VAKKWTTKVFRNIDMLFNILKDLQRGWEEGGEHVVMTRGEPTIKSLHRKRKQQGRKEVPMGVLAINRQRWMQLLMN
jgi:hypothetical protein